MTIQFNWPTEERQYVQVYRGRGQDAVDICTGGIWKAAFGGGLCIAGAALAWSGASHLLDENSSKGAATLLAGVILVTIGGVTVATGAIQACCGCCLATLNKID